MIEKFHYFSRSSTHPVQEEAQGFRRKPRTRSRSCNDIKTSAIRWNAISFPALRKTFAKPSFRARENPGHGQGRGAAADGSFPRKRECGFTFQVQHLVDKNLRGGGIPEAFPRGVVVSVNQVMKPLVGEGRQVGFTVSTQSQDVPFEQSEDVPLGGFGMGGWCSKGVGGWPVDNPVAASLRPPVAHRLHALARRGAGTVKTRQGEGVEEIPLEGPGSAWAG